MIYVRWQDGITHHHCLQGVDWDSTHRFHNSCISFQYSYLQPLSAFLQFGKVIQAPFFRLWFCSEKKNIKIKFLRNNALPKESRNSTLCIPTWLQYSIQGMCVQHPRIPCSRRLPKQRVWRLFLNLHQGIPRLRQQRIVIQSIFAFIATKKMCNMVTMKGKYSKRRCPYNFLQCGRLSKGVRTEMAPNVILYITNIAVNKLPLTSQQ